ncbi:MAG: metalloregulator ArsR/SmtB family transcription factor [Anaerolineales bacterium]|jgi:ArsR family transcriptional regulator
MTKTTIPSSLAKVSDLLQVISPEVRLEILLAIGSGEVCVCHLETGLGYRQAYISQHLMALREAGVLSTRRDGKYIFYRLERPEIMEIVDMTARLAGFDVSIIVDKANRARSSCNCPNCSTQAVNRETA